MKGGLVYLVYQKSNDHENSNNTKKKYCPSNLYYLCCSSNDYLYGIDDYAIPIKIPSETLRAWEGKIN
jgi:hypothetical protein